MRSAVLLRTLSLAVVVLSAIPQVALARDPAPFRAAQRASPEGFPLHPRKALPFESVRDIPTVLLGIVVAVDRTHGDLVVGHGDGTRSDLNADPVLLRKIQIGDPVKVVVEGSTVRTVEELGAPSPRA